MMQTSKAVNITEVRRVRAANLKQQGNTEDHLDLIGFFSIWAQNQNILIKRNSKCNFSQINQSQKKYPETYFRICN